MSNERRSTPDLSEQQVNRLLRSYLREEWHEDANRVASSVLDELDTTPQRRAGWPAWRSLFMNNNLVRVGLAAAAVVVIAIIAINLLPGTRVPGDEPSTSPSVEPSEAPSSTKPSSSAEAAFGEGPFSFEPTAPEISTGSGMTLTVSVPAADWYFDPMWSLMGPNAPEDAPFAAFWAFPGAEFYVPADPCLGDSTKPATPTNTVDEIAAALAAQASRSATEPVDVTIGGYAGKSLTLHAPDGVPASGCEKGEFVTYYANEFWRNVQRDDEVSELWILDVDGTIVIIDGVSSPHNSTEQVDLVRTAVESTTFELP
jgi:hypothetical protein